MRSVLVWLHAVRPRTLLLSVTSVLMGSFLAAYHFSFRYDVFIFSLLTAVLLQVLSNLSNDYGDAMHGADHAGRIGPARMVQSGLITAANMKLAIVITVLFTLTSGILLLYLSLQSIRSMLFFLILGLAAIAAAIFYTAGKKPYGYRGWGDVMVFLFFGLVGVEGVFYLHTHQLLITGLLPASVVGFLSTAVLNVNNLRDYESDARAGKSTWIVQWGIARGKFYHAVLISLAFLCALAFSLLILFDTGALMPMLSLLVFPFLFKHLHKVMRMHNLADLDPELKKVALSAFAYSLLLGIGILS